MIGVTQSLANPLASIPLEASSIGADTFQIFTRNPRTCRQRKSFDYELQGFNESLISTGIYKYVIHAPYCMNLATDDVEARQRNINTIVADIRQMKRMSGVKYYVLHPGSHMYSPNWANNLMQTINGFYGEISDSDNIHVCFEMMSGKGSELLSNLDMIYWLLIQTRDLPNRGLCFDSCHVYAAGLPLIDTLKELASHIKVLHLNNSFGAAASHVDRHAPFDRGRISMKELREVFTTFNELCPQGPIVLETPTNTMLNDFYDLKRWIQN